MEIQPADPHIPHNLSPLDAMLADVALRIQLSPTDYGKAVARYEALAEWLDRPDSPLRGRVELVYPQGSMAIAATIARSSERDEYDIDAMAQLGLPRDADPEYALSLLHASIRGEPGSRYHDMVVRRTRCVTIQYADGMHLDITPAVRLVEQPERTSYIFHSKPEDPREAKQRLHANPYGFAEWFVAATAESRDLAFAEYFERRSLEDARLRLLAKGETEPVPEQMPVFRKALALIALQLLKRFRNLRYEGRTGLRRPPSVLVSKSVGDHANRGTTLADELLQQATALADRLETASRAGLRVSELNPTCPRDVLTDRWPANLAEQDRFAADLRELTSKLERLIQGTRLDETRAILADLFGERPARDVVDAYVKRYGAQVQQGRGSHFPVTGQIPPAAVVATATPALARPTDPHTFYGDRET